MLFKFLNWFLNINLYTRLGYIEDGVVRYSHKVLGVWFNSNIHSDDFPIKGMMVSIGSVGYHDEFGFRNIELLGKLFGYVDEVESEVINEIVIEKQGNIYQLKFRFITECFSNLRFISKKTKVISICKEGEEPFTVRHFEEDKDFSGAIDRYEKILGMTRELKSDLEELGVSNE